MPAEPTYVPHMTAALMTADQLLHVSIPGKRVELVRGALIVREPPGYQHGRVVAELALQLGNHLRATRIGQITVGDTGFKIATNPDTVRGADIAFINGDRVPAPGTVGFPTMGPDVVVEVLSPHDRPGETLAKVGDWLEAGTKLVWVIDPERRAARVYRQDGTETSINAEEQLEGEDVLPGFSCPLTAIL